MPPHDQDPQNPSPSPRPSPRPSEGAEGSAPSPRDSSAASEFIEEPGPGFDPASAQAPEPGEPAGELHALPEPADLWEEEAVRSILTAQGQLTHAAVGVGELDWVHTEADLAAIAPPLTRILNRYPATRAAAGTGDELALIIGLGGYTVRSYSERRAVLAAALEEEPVPVSGVPAEEGTGPPTTQAEAEAAGLQWTTP